MNSKAIGTNQQLDATPGLDHATSQKKDRARPSERTNKDPKTPGLNTYPNTLTERSTINNNIDNFQAIERETYNTQKNQKNVNDSRQNITNISIGKDIDYINTSATGYNKNFFNETNYMGSTQQFQMHNQQQL